MKKTLVLAVLLASAPAAASCIRLDCFCPANGRAPASAGTLQATVEQIDGPRTSFRIDQVSGTTPGYAAGATLVTQREKPDAVGQQWLVFIDGEDVTTRMRISAGKVTCENSKPTFSLPVSEAHAVFVAPNCGDVLAMRGLSYPCNDTGGGCASTDAGFAWAAAWWVGLLVRRRKR